MKKSTPRHIIVKLLKTKNGKKNTLAGELRFSHAMHSTAKERERGRERERKRERERERWKTRRQQNTQNEE